MLLHILKYKFICLIRDRAIIFWAFMFPVILAVLFHIVLMSISSNEEPIEVRFSVVENPAFHQDVRFNRYIHAIIDSYENESQSIYNVSIGTLEETEQLLSDGKIDGYVIIEDAIKLIVKTTGAEQSIINALLDAYIQTNAQSVVFNDNYVEQLPLTEGNNRDFGVMIYYSLIAMSCLYASFWGLRIILLSQADLTCVGARMALVPQRKLKILAIDFLVSWIIQMGIIVFQFIFMVSVLKIELLKPIGLVFVLTAVGSAMAISLGAFIGVVIRKDEDTQVTIINSIIGIGYVITISQVSEIIEDKIPILGYINPIKLINDGLLSLYYFDNFEILVRNVAIMFWITFCFGTITYFIVRRVKYASI